MRETQKKITNEWKTIDACTDPVYTLRDLEKPMHLLERVKCSPSLYCKPSSPVCLPCNVLSAMEELFGTNLRRVTIHPASLLASKLGARAFAFQDQLHFAPGEYDTSSAEGWRVLGHEFAHVIQQRLGCAEGNGPDRPYVLHDQALEWEADWAGECAERLFQGDKIIRPLPYVRRIPSTHCGSLAIQCLMDVNTFKTASATMGRRDKIAAVDTELAAFHALNAVQPRNYVTILAQLRRLYAACQTYERQSPGSKRLAGVASLVRQIATEEAYLQPLSKYSSTTDLLRQFDAIEEAQEIFLTLKGRPDFTRGEGCVQEIGNLHMLIDQRTYGNPSLVANIILREIDELKKLITRSTLPSMLKFVIQEATANKNVVQLDMQVGKPGATYNFVSGGAKYTLKHAIDQYGGKKFRMGSLLHELTHVSIAETFKNTVVLLAIKQTATDTEMMNLARARNAKIVQLISLIEGDTSIDNDMRRELKDKAEYATSMKMSMYIGAFAAQLGSAMVARLNNLISQGMKSELVEYDTVINQMALWCYLSGLPINNAVYAYLMTLVQEAYVERANARATPPPVVKQVAKGTIPAIKMPSMVQAGSSSGEGSSFGQSPSLRGSQG